MTSDTHGVFLGSNNKGAPVDFSSQGDPLRPTSREDQNNYSNGDFNGIRTMQISRR